MFDCTYQIEYIFIMKLYCTKQLKISTGVSFFVEIFWRLFILWFSCIKLMDNSDIILLIYCDISTAFSSSDGNLLFPKWVCWFFSVILYFYDAFLHWNLSGIKKHSGISLWILCVSYLKRGVALYFLWFSYVLCSALHCSGGTTN